MAAIKTFCILLMGLGVQLVVVESSDDDQPFRFGYVIEKGEEEAGAKKIASDFAALFRQLDAGDVKIWEVTERQTIVTGHPAFDSRMCYVIKERPSRKFELYVRIWYWVGKTATLETAMNAAAFAVELAQQNNAGNRIRREVEGYESVAFRVLGLYNPKELESSKNASSLAKKTTTFREKRMFVIDGKGGPNLREVVVSSAIFEEEDTEICVVLITEKVYVRCGRDAPTWARRGAEALANIMRVRNRISGSNIVILQTHICECDLPYPERMEVEEFFDQIPDEETVNERGQLEFMNDLNEFTEAELRQILPQTMVWHREGEEFGPVGLKISEGSQNTISEQPLSLRDALKPSDCCIIDNHEVVGLFVWMGRESKLIVRQATARKAEKYLKDKNYRFETPIAFVDDDDIPEQIRNPKLEASSNRRTV